MLAHLVRRKQVTDLTTSALIQRALETYVTVGWYQAHLRRSCQAYRRRRDAMVRAIARYLPAGARAETPLGGLFLWLRLPPPLAAPALAPLAAAEGGEYPPAPVLRRSRRRRSLPAPLLCRQPPTASRRASAAWAGHAQSME